MRNPFLSHLVPWLSLVMPLVAQGGDDVVFVGTSTAGDSDPFFLVAADAGGLRWSGAAREADNVRGATWDVTGGSLFVSRLPGVAPGVLPAGISRCDWNGSSGSWSSLWTAPGGCVGLGLDAGRQRLWVMSGPTTNQRELRAIDVAPGSLTYGTTVAATAVLGGAIHDRWQLAPSGNYAAVSYSQLSVLGCLDVVDLEPSRPTYLQNVAHVVSGGGIGVDCAISADEQFAYLLCSPLQLVVVHLPTGTLLDFDAAHQGQQNLVLPLGSTTSLALAPDRSFAMVTGIGGGGFVVRIDFDYTAPERTTWRQFLPGQLPNCYGASLSADATRVAFTATVGSGTAAVTTLRVLDVTSGLELHQTTLPGSSAATWTAWRDDARFASWTPFGHGCAGSLGVPTLAAASGSRPVLGDTFGLVVGGVPQGLAFVGFGTSNATWSGGVLPTSLAGFGMPGCTLYVDPAATTLVLGNGTAAWSWPVPAGVGWYGTRFHTQAFVLDTVSNAAGVVLSNAGSGQLGF